MSDDLVRRLREYAIHMDAWGKEANHDADIVDEAADRIEQDAQHIDEMYELVTTMNADHTASKTRIEKLEVALQEIAEAVGDPSAYWIARKALEGEDD